MLTIPPPAATEALFDRAEAALRRMLAVEPHNAAALARLGDLERRRGDFAAALTAYRRLLAVAPDDAAAAWAVAVLGGDRLPEAPPSAGRIAPFVRLTDFLPPASRDRLLRDMLAAGERFAPARVRVNARIIRNRELRDALVLDKPTTQDVRSWFVPKLRAVLPEVLRRLRLRMADLDLRRIVLKVAGHLHGHFFAAHRDAGRFEDQILSYVYFFHRAPKPFAGGDLLLHDAGRAGGGPAGAFSRIEPLCGSIVFFPSDCLHEVTPVACGTDFGDGRFTVHGWFHGVRRCTGA